MDNRERWKQALFVHGGNCVMTPCKTIVVVCWVGCLGLLAAGLFAAEPQDLIRNGGFEEGLDGWIAAPGHELVSENGAARTGKTCLTGEVTKPNTHLSLRQRVHVKAGNRYLFRVAVRATNRTKLVLFITEEGKRRNVVSWQNVPAKWRRYNVAVPFHSDGEIELELILPSSHGAPAGRMWVDNVSLIETPMPPRTSVSQDDGFNDEPAMALADDGSLYVAWNSFRDQADSVQIARYQEGSDGLARQANWQAVGGPETFVMGVTAVSAGPKAVVLYAAEVDGNWDIFAVHCGSDGPGRPMAVSRGAEVDVNPAAAWHDGTLWVAWESNRDSRRQIMAASLRDGTVSAPTRISEEGISSYDPTVAILPGGEACVAWHGFRDHNYDLFLSRRASEGEWGSVTRLTKAAGVDRHAVLVAHGNQLWLAYENAQVEEYYIGRTNFRRIMIAQVTADGLRGLPDYRNSPLWGRCEAPAFRFDRSGRMWVAFLRPRLPRSGWDTYLTCYDGKRWLKPQPLSLDKGMDRRPALAGMGNRWIVAFQSDTIPGSWSSLDQTPTARSNIFLANHDPGVLPAAASLTGEPLDEPDEPFEAAELRIARGEDAPTPSIDYDGKRLKLFYGDLHQHSDVSVCNRLGDQSIEEDYQFSRDINRLDFACSTDHGYNINPYLWSCTAKLARANEDPGRYLTFLAEEWTSTFEEYSAEHPYGFYGHRNLIFGDVYFPRWWNARNRQTPADVWEDLRKLNADFVHIPHQLADTGNVPTDWNFADEQAQPVAEIFQVRGSYEYKGTPREAKRSTPPGYFLQDAWARGVVIGIIASPDHGGGYGKACVYAPDLSRKAILNGLRDRHCFGTTGSRMFIDMRVDGHLMGDKVADTPTSPVTVKIHVRCPVDIDRIEICRNNEFVYINQPLDREAKLTFVDMEPAGGRSYYYVRVIQTDEEIGWTSPVWFGAK
ncbi:MAG: hypothetical protein ACC628_02390 [Pirellulaceae bacterium]